MALFPEDRPVEIGDEHVVQIRLKEVQLRRPRQWGACWLACHLYEQLGLDEFWADQLVPSRKRDALGSDRPGVELLSFDGAGQRMADASALV